MYISSNRRYTLENYKRKNQYIRENTQKPQYKFKSIHHFYYTHSIDLTQILLYVKIYI